MQHYLVPSSICSGTSNGKLALKALKAILIDSATLTLTHLSFLLDIRRGRSALVFIRLLPIAFSYLDSIVIEKCGNRKPE